MLINNFKHIISSENFDIIHYQKINLDEKIVKSSELIYNVGEYRIRIKFELAESGEINKSNFLFIPETNYLFYRGNIEWCAFDLIEKVIVRNESAIRLFNIERRNNIVIIYDELYVESTDLRAKLIDNVPVDPPTKSIDYDDRIEFESPVFGKRTLKLK